MRRWIALMVMVSTVAPAGGDPASPYQGQETRGIKALSAQEVADLLAGEGMGFAKAAELNGYPGPAHVLELAEELELSPNQLERTRSIFSEMKARAIAAGRDLVDAERELDRGFREKTMAAGSLEALLDRIGALQAELRRLHLDAHLRQTQLLSDAQIAAYAEMRGYGDGHHRDGRDAHPH